MPGFKRFGEGRHPPLNPFVFGEYRKTCSRVLAIQSSVPTTASGNGPLHPETWGSSGIRSGAAITKQPCAGSIRFILRP